MTPPATIPLLAALEQKKLLAQKEFSAKHEGAQKWLAEKGLTLDEIRVHSQKLLTGVALGGALLLASPQLPQINKTTTAIYIPQPSPEKLLSFLQDFPSESNSKLKELELTDNVKKFYSVDTTFELAGNRLPTFFGKIGLEQHLARFPGDSVSTHGAYVEKGMAPARGAFGYFAETGKSYEEMVLQEKYYVNFRTFDIPNWNQDWVTLKEWYKFRKFLVINLENGQAVVGCLGDAGPAAWTGKDFGGSPEVMAELGFLPRATKGNVLFLYVDDPENNIRLGPVQLRGE